MGFSLPGGRRWPTGARNVVLLMLANALAFAATPMMMFVGSLVGTELAPSASWATLPIASMVVGTALGVMPATQVMRRLGRKWGLFLFCLCGAASCLLGGYGVAQQSFVIFCASAALLGMTNAALQQMRFAAMESVDQNHSPSAAAMVMCGGIVAAILGPELAVMGFDFTAVAYEGSYWLVALSFIGAALLLLGYQGEAQETTVAQGQGRNIGELLRSPSFCLAMASGCVAFVVMSFVMTGTPISMHHHQGHSLEDTKWVIQWHIASMFLPSLAAPLLFRWLKIRGLMVAGLLCYCGTIVIGLMDLSVMGYWYQLVLLGIGWNFLFVSGTALLPTSYAPHEAYRAQALNDSAVFSMQALAALTAGVAISNFSWASILLVCLLPMLLMLVALLRERFTLTATPSNAT